MRIVERKAEKALSEATADRVEIGARALDRTRPSRGSRRSSRAGRGAGGRRRPRQGRTRQDRQRGRGRLRGAEGSARGRRPGGARDAGRPPGRLRVARRDRPGAYGSRGARERDHGAQGAAHRPLTRFRRPGAERCRPVADVAKPSALATTQPGPKNPPPPDRRPGTAGNPARPASRMSIASYEDAALSALRERLDEVADAIVRATEAPPASEIRSAKARAAKSRDQMRVVSPAPVAERAGA